MKDWKFCPRCGAGTRLAGTGEDAHVACPACRFTKYDNPLPTTVGLVLDGDRILLLRRAHEPRKGGWDTVGGFLSGGETAEENLVREGREEIGCELRNLRFAGSYSSVYGDTGLRTIGLAFTCELPPDTEIALSEENSGYAWFPLDDRPPLAFADGEAAAAALTSRTGSA
ncbi:NUDIX domain-containing protein [Amycolatopsis regifaucium]|uniref:NUDIX hydrolase n=1 Tax=Amycolatopsis regifaucium TaxID=546365 RepID=A0A154M8H4_9PSEU|nr:NUDIX domain-containing protein [Amycolatopsis regifaucium]KZB80723.1 NUDIX hydrolase [Amycolatopsis regifaucium]OKA07740.1 NUDIX hydrolase [Amycolatopsis regifaucium]SFH03822.1 ADP-ribose pyrophosphatase YjhB, NUDIX family [Amycolatopsis regifaucium]